MLNRRILTIEDDEAQRNLIRKTLEKRNYSVLMAAGGEKGLEMAREERPDLILLDVVMPGLKGNEVCKRLKADLRTKDIPILFLTSADSPKEVIDQYDVGAEVHLAKPISPKELIAQIEITFQDLKKPEE
ncbi:MAG: response regulator [Candidatus Omnitrophota bacterium]